MTALWCIFTASLTSDSFKVALISANTYGLLNVYYEDFSVTDLACACIGDCRFYDPIEHVRGNDGLDLYFRKKARGVLGSLKELGVPLLFSIALQFGHSYAVYASERQPLAYILTLEWLMIAVMSFIAFLTEWRLYRWWPSINLFKAVTSPFGKSEPLWTNPGRLLAKV